MKKILYFFVIPFLLLLFPVLAFASDTNGTVLSPYAWGENLGWINFAPTSSGTYLGLTITDSAVTGYAWSKDAGWINFGPVGSSQGVTNTPDGSLGGSAWSTALGWIAMSGVSIDSTGTFHGLAGTAGSSAGRVSFDCANCGVTTDWRPLSARVQTQTVAQSGGILGGGGSLQKATPEERAKILKIADFNHDGRVDVEDLSILLYYYGKTGPQIIPYDLNGDGKIDIIDTSILLYYWDITS